MRYLILLTFLTSLTTLARAQKVDSIFFNLYTDSLKKGTYNYINVDGKLSDGRWLPMTARELTFSTTGGTFTGNSLFIDTTFKEPKVTIKVTLKQQPAITKEITIYIKTTFPEEKLKTTDELLKEWERKRKKGKG